jgi:hypothetical protein
MNPTIKKQELLGIITKNRDAHKDIFLKACEGFQKEMLKRLAQKMKLIRAGRLVNSYVDLPIPEDHTRDYNRVIRMIELDTRDTIQLTEAEFTQFVMDDWAWKKQWVSTASNYTAMSQEDLDAAEIEQ